MGNAIAELKVVSHLAARAIRRWVTGQIESPPDLDEFTRAMEAALATTRTTMIRDYRWLDLPAQRPPWVASGLQLAAGDEVTYLIEGRVYANRFLDIYVSPAIQVWCKVGKAGEIFRGTRSSHSFHAGSAGELLYGNYFPNDWTDMQGSRLQNDSVYSGVSGGLKILVIRWTGSALEGLRALAAENDPGGRLQAEISRIEQGDTTPQGWHYLWNLGAAEIYRDRHADNGDPCIHCHTDADVGILQTAVDLPLTASTQINWRWCIEQLPSTLREDVVPTHDYLSIAVEFDNGRDITYYWSSNLPVGTGYDCPLPNWHGREFHVVIRSGTKGLGAWHAEQRNIYNDYRHYMGEPPARIVKVWLIANSLFQRRPGTCDYADIVLSSDQGKIRVL